MREIKFRAKSTDDQKWVYGYYTLIKYSDGEASTIRTKYGYLIMVDPETVGQYTGLKDSNGREIYEGDIVYDPWGDKHIVIWDEESMMFTYDVNEWWMPYLWCRSFEADELDKPDVIGNVYDNPELLGD